MSSEKSNMVLKEVMILLHFGRGGKNINDKGIQFLWVNGQALKFTVQDGVTYAMMSVLPTILRLCVETVYVNNQGILKYLRHTLNGVTDSIVDVDLVSKKVIVTDHQFSGSRVAVMCHIKGLATFAKFNKARVAVSGGCEQMGSCKPGMAPSAVKLANGTFVYPVPECKCEGDKWKHHDVYRFLSDSYHGDKESFYATNDWRWVFEGPTIDYKNKELPEFEDRQPFQLTYPLVISFWGSTQSTRLEIPVTDVVENNKQHCQIRHMNYPELKRHWGSNNKQSPVSAPANHKASTKTLATVQSKMIGN